MGKWIAWSARLLGLVGTLWTGYMQVDKTYARTVWVSEQLSDTKLLILEDKRRALQKERFDLKREQNKRSLVDIEEGRLDEIDNDLKHLDEKIKRLETQ